MEFKAWFQKHEALRYGNYCGPGPPCPKSGLPFVLDPDSPTPVNDVDRLCQKHDQEYCQCGASWKDFLGKKPCVISADNRLIHRVRQILKLGELQGKERVAAHVIDKLFRTRRGNPMYTEPMQEPA